MNLRESNYSRVIQKPKREVIVQFNAMANFDLEQDVHEKIDYLRKKMVVSKRREEVFRQESTEISANTAEDLMLLIQQNELMKSNLNEALYSEVDTVKNALRTHPNFQMAMTNKGAEECISWLEDKIFDMAKVVNGLTCKLCSKQAKLDEVEMMVRLLEKFPRPGSSAYEIELQERLKNVRLEIELAIYRRTTAAVLLKKYKEVKGDVERENGQFEQILKEMERKIDELYAEKKVMDNILAVAQKFQQQKVKDLNDYEKAYNANYKIRRAQLRKKRKQTEAKLEEEEKMAIQESRRIQAEQQKMNSQVDPKRSAQVAEKQSRLRDRIEQYRMKLSKIQEVMRADNVNKVIIQMRHIVWLAYRLERESVLKAQLNIILEKQRNSLLMLKCHMQYEGFVENREYVEKKAELLTERQEIEEEVKRMHERMNSLNETNTETTMGLFMILRKLGDRSKMDKSFKQRVRTMSALMEGLKDELMTARDEVSDPARRKQFMKLLRPPKMERRLVRVGTPPPQDDANDIDDAARDVLADLNVPGRAQVKERNERFLKRILIKKSQGQA